MTRLATRLGIALIGLAVLAAPAPAQRRMRGRRAVRVERPGFGPRLGYDFDADRGFLGGQLNVPVGRRWALAPSADFYLGASGTPYRLNADLKFHPPTAYGFFYFGGGLAVLHASGNTDTGANLFGGWEGRRYAPVRPFLEGRFVFSDNTSFNVLVGFNAPM